ncbi:MAG: TetR/AcrR family transcriptional regulator [Eubacteriales bacterium]|nr:TetR/AcrR family transcriptional regulator [Eubacteriales bacterium]
MGKVDQNKQQKLEKLLESAQALFLSKGIADTSISEITSRAGVAKGTFYLYFKDKYSIRDHLISRSAKSLFISAHTALQHETQITDFEDKIIFITDHIVKELEKNRPLLRFVSKNLSWGLFRQLIDSNITDEGMTGQEIFDKVASECSVSLKDPEIMIFMIIELVNAATYSAIIGNGPVSLARLLPYLNDAIRAIIRNHME